MALTVDDAGLAARLDRIKKLTDDLEQTQTDSQTARHLVATIQREVAAAREAVKTLITHPPSKSR